MQLHTTSRSGAMPWETLGAPSAIFDLPGNKVPLAVNSLSGVGVTDFRLFRMQALIGSVCFLPPPVTRLLLHAELPARNVRTAKLTVRTGHHGTWESWFAQPAARPLRYSMDRIDMFSEEPQATVMVPRSNGSHGLPRSMIFMSTHAWKILPGARY